MKIAFIAKTNLNNDGRILNEIKILQKFFPHLKFDFILLPDKPVAVDLGPNVNILEVKTLIRHVSFLRVFTLVEFTIKALILLFKLKPDVIHAQDTSVVLPVLIYRVICGKGFKLIYDDHEIFNETSNLEMKFYSFLEVKLIKEADFVIFANEERMNLLRNEYNLTNKCSYLLNLPYFDEEYEELIDIKLHDQLKELDFLKSSGTKFIIHQGILDIQRGRFLLAKFSKIIPMDFKILLLGGSRKDYEFFLNEFELNEQKFHFIGSVNYLDLPKFWNRGSASIVLYLPTYLNNKLCAPNRLYISVKKGLPVIVNKNNPVLSNFINRYNCGFYIEDINNDFNFKIIEKYNQNKFVKSYEKIREEQINNFLGIYLQ